jgi:hypothetical protein
MVKKNTFTVADSRTVKEVQQKLDAVLTSTSNTLDAGRIASLIQATETLNALVASLLFRQF